MADLRRLVILAVMLTALAVGGDALAGGRATCSLQFGLDPRSRCFIEQTLFVIPLGFAEVEWAAGLYLEPHRSWTPFPYTLVGVFASTWWVALEVGKYLDGRFRHAPFTFAISAGVRW